MITFLCGFAAGAVWAFCVATKSLATRSWLREIAR